jgi:phosphoglycerate dehydrogenase-like enzyme
MNDRQGRRIVVWFDQPPPAALGPLPATVTVAPEPREDVTVAVLSGMRGVSRLHEMPALELVQLRSSGADRVLAHLPAGVTLCAARAARADSVAEWVLAALLADVKDLHRFAQAQAEHRWDYHEVGDLATLRVLLLGYGTIGHAIADRLAPFGTGVTAVARRARPGVHAIEALDALLPDVDAVINVLPLTDDTAGLVDARRLALLPDGALYVAAGRGPTTDTDALLAELRSGRLRAVLDVMEPEPLPDDHPLWTVPNAVISPHVGGHSYEGTRRAWALAGDQLRRYAAGEPLADVVGEAPAELASGSLREPG